MTDPIDTKIRSLVTELVDSSPLAPPFPASRARGVRRSRSRAAVLAAVMLAALVAGLAFAVRFRTSHTSVATRPGASSRGVIVIDNGVDKAALIDSATSRTRTVALAHKGGGDYPNALLATGGFFIYPGDGGTWAIATSLSGSPRLLGSSSYDVASTTPGRVWLVTTAISGRPIPVTAQEVSADGRYRGHRYQVPAGYRVIIGTTEGLLLSSADRAVVWDPATARFGTQFPGLSAGSLVDVHGSMVAWCSGNNSCPTVRVADLNTGRSRDYAAPAGTLGWVPTGGEGSRDAFAPDGQYLAMRAAYGASQAGPSDLYLLQLATGLTSMVPGSRASPYSRVAWLPDGRRVVTASDNGSVETYDLATRERRTYRATLDVVALLTVTG